MTGSTGTLLAVGSYTDGDATGGDPPGLTTWWWDGDIGIRAAGSADLASPSFACWHPTLPLLYAVSELPDGSVTTARVAPDGTLRVAATTSTGGAHPCWVTVDPAGSALLIANYGSGSMAVLALDGDGMPAGGPVVVAHQGSGPVVDRQDGPHVHQVVPTTVGTVLASDLGTDRIVEYRIDIDPAGSPSASVTAVGTIVMPAGSGTRHMALAAGGRTGFVTGELDATVTVIRRRPDSGRSPGAGGAPSGEAPSGGARSGGAQAGGARSGGSIPVRDGSGWVASEQVPCSADRTAQPSQLMLAPGDRWLLVANRGPDTLAVIEVGRELSIRQEIGVGAGPRYFTIDGDRVLLACQQAGAVQVLALDGATGRLTALGDLDAGPGATRPFRAPSCVAVRR